MKRLCACLAALLYTASPALGAGLPQPADSPAGQPASVDATAYTHWLEERSMLHQAQVLAQRYSGTALQWQHPYGKPQPRAAVSRASVWFTAYPASTIAASAGTSVLSTLSYAISPIRPPSTAISTASASRSIRRSAPRRNTRILSRPRVPMALSSSATSFRGTPARDPTSAWPKGRTPTTRVSTTWCASSLPTGDCCRPSPRDTTPSI